jgi:hypothetical protein
MGLGDHGVSFRDDRSAKALMKEGVLADIDVVIVGENVRPNHHAPFKRWLRCQAPAVQGASVCRMHGAGGGAQRVTGMLEAWGLHRQGGRDAAAH